MRTVVRILFSILVAAGLFISSCKEVPPNIDLTTPVTPGDTVTVPFDAALSLQKRNVLIEDFTGVRCINCPKAHVAAADIARSYPAGRVVVVAEHDSAGLLTIPYSFGQYDFRTVQAKDIVAVVGPVPAKPIGAIDRKLFAGESARVLAMQKWAGYVAQQMADSVSQVQIKTEHSYDEATRKISLGVILQFTQSITSALNLSVMLTESGMKEPQLGGPNEGPTGIDTFYIHHHVLRGMMTPSLGRIISGNKTPGHATKYLLPDFTIPASWNADSTNIVTFVTAGTDSVLQVTETKLK